MDSSINKQLELTPKHQLKEKSIYSDPFDPIVISSNAYCRAKSDLIIMAITSRIRSNQGIGEFQMDKWQEAGLLKPSVVKPVITTITKSLIRKTLGQLEQADREQLKLTIENILG